MFSRWCGGEHKRQVFFLQPGPDNRFFVAGVEKNPLEGALATLHELERSSRAVSG